MTVTLFPGPRSGFAEVPVSKSLTHRYLLASALSSGVQTLRCLPLSDDLSATVRCLRALGIRAVPDENGTFLSVSGALSAHNGAAELDCGESGTTLRLLLPVCAALGIETVFRMGGRLPDRPLGALTEELNAHGAQISKDGSDLICRGRLRPGAYRIPGDVSSQFVSGLLFALPLLEGDSTLEITTPVESAPYVAMTENVLSECGPRAESSGEERFFRIEGRQSFRAPANPEIEADWSAAAVFLCAGATSRDGVTVPGLNEISLQGDKDVLPILRSFGAEILFRDGCASVRRGELTGHPVDASQIPDLVPVLAAVAAGARGETVFTRAARLRRKETDRLKTVSAMLNGLGADVRETDDGLIVRGRRSLRGGTVSSFGDHRVAMAAAVAAQFCEEPVILEGAECVSKSFPSFWDRFSGLKPDPIR